MSIFDTGSARHARDQREASPKVIVLCGSSRFVEIMAVAAWILERDEGAITMGLHLLPNWYSTEPIPNHLAEHEGCAPHMDELHLRKIDLADEVFVINWDDYVGESTSREIAYAGKLDKPVRWITHPDERKIYEEVGRRMSDAIILSKPHGGWAPGNYPNKCCMCGTLFEGDKRAMTCRKCADEEFEKWMRDVKKEVEDLKSTIFHLEECNMKLYAGRDCPNCGKRVNMHTESDLVLTRQKDLETAMQMKRSLVEVAELICDAGPLAWVHARPEHADYLRFMESANEWEKRAAAWLRGARGYLG